MRYKIEKQGLFCSAFCCKLLYNRVCLKKKNDLFNIETGVKLEDKGIIKKVIDFIGKDTKSQNESKKLIVVIRILLLSIALYYLLNGVVSGITLSFGKLFLFMLFLLICIGVFIMSYHCKTLITLWVFNVGTMVWIVTMVHLFGWNIGVQHFLIMLLILYFFSSYKQYAGKIIYAVVLGVIRIVLFYFYQNRIATWPLTMLEEEFFQIVNTVIIFWCLSVIAFIFSNDTQELEGKLVDYNNQLEKQANTDTLTGLYNRRKALDFMEDICKNQIDQLGFSVCICDIDFFKKVNDNYGHDIGDEVLKKIAGVFKEEIQGNNFVARWGGEEFLLVFPQCNGDEAYIVLEQIRKKIKEIEIKKDDLVFGVTMTFGIAEYDFQQGLNATIKEADEKLYIGKEKGRDIIIF